ncbi:glycosyltransferase family 4 protein [Candidatus Poribacteria bacterium]|nr:glycosyltransferase family 4 protein [Candidatus Poribacteria bacterium]
MKPILYLSHTGASIGGGEKQLYYLLTHLDRTKYQPIVVFPEDGVFADQVREVGIPSFIIHLPHWRKVISRFTRSVATTKLTNLAKKQNIQIVHTSDSWFNPYILQLKKQLNIPVISHVRNLLTIDQVSKYCFDELDYTISISEQSKSPLINYGIPNNKIEIILNCVDTNEFTSKQSKEQESSAEFTIGIVGRIEPFKQQKQFIKIASKVNKQCEKVKFKIIGDVLDIPKHQRYYKEVIDSISDYGLEKVVSFTGYRNDMPIYMKEINILVTLSAGSVIAEAMASGKPVVANSIGSASDMIVDGTTGWVIHTDLIEQMSDRIIQLIRNPALYNRMCLAAREHAKSQFSIDQHVHKIQGIYEKLLG